MHELQRRFLSCTLLVLVKVVEASIKPDAKAEKPDSSSQDSDSVTLESQVGEFSALIIGGWYVSKFSDVVIPNT
jgi:hypothetical protein